MSNPSKTNEGKEYSPQRQPPLNSNDQELTKTSNGGKDNGGKDNAFTKKFITAFRAQFGNSHSRENDDLLKFDGSITPVRSNNIKYNFRSRAPVIQVVKCVQQGNKSKQIAVERGAESTIVPMVKSKQHKYYEIAEKKDRLSMLKKNTPVERPISEASRLKQFDKVRRRNELVIQVLEESSQTGNFAMAGLTKPEKGERNSECEFEMQIKKLSNYIWPWENVALEGGGCKGIAYIGAIQVLEQVGAWKNVKRLAGTSAGAITATLLAIGCTTAEIVKYLSLDLKQLTMDHRWGFLSFWPSLKKHFGWNPGMRLYEWFGQVLQTKTNNPDVTFQGIYEQFGKELCIVVTNCSQSCEEYLHVKTRPDMPVRLALRMSMSIPGLFQAVKEKSLKRTDVYVDGGIVANFPLHCYDGWWLSMKAQDSFFRKLQPFWEIPKLLSKEVRFQPPNPQTLGFMVYADGDPELMRESLDLRNRKYTTRPVRPSTKLAAKAAAFDVVKSGLEKEHMALLICFDKFIHALARMCQQDDSFNSVDKETFTKILDGVGDHDFHHVHATLLFGEDFDYDTVWNNLDKNNDGKVSFVEMLSFAETLGATASLKFISTQRANIKGLSGFFRTMLDLVVVNMKQVYMVADDIERIIGINTDYVSTTTFKLDQLDKEYVVKLGQRAAIAFLLNYIDTHPEVKQVVP